MRRNLMIAVATTVILGGGYVHGLWTQRWTTPEELGRVVARVENIPMKIGDWEGRSEQLQARATRIAGIAGYCYRPYTNRRTGKTITVLLMGGRAGPMSVHSPDVCYRGLGYQMAGSMGTKEYPFGLDQVPAEFFVAKFAKNDVSGPSHLHILWSWGWQGDWRAPENPRLAFAGSPGLFKLYIIQQVTPTPEAEKADHEARQEFLDLLMPEIKKALHP